METKDLCVYHVQSLRTAYVRQELEQCVSCNDYSHCERYKPLSRSQEPFRVGLNVRIIRDLQEILG